MSDVEFGSGDETPVRPAAAAAPIERSISPISGRLGAGRAGKELVVAALVVGCGVFVAATWRGTKPHAATAAEQPAR